jgi:quercetin dioxygenase-like cupin family protein
MDTYQWDKIEKEAMNPLFTRQVIHSDRMTVARLQLAKGCVVPAHSHDNEQITTIEKGRVRCIVSGEERILTAGQMVRFPSNATHSVEALEDSVAVDLFSPRREDWIRGDDAYLRK